MADEYTKHSDRDQTHDTHMYGHEYMEHEMSHDRQSMHDMSTQDMGNHTGYEGMGGYSRHGSREEHGGHRSIMVADFKKRFWISLIISIPVLILSPLIQRFIGIEGDIVFTGDEYVLFILSSGIFSMVAGLS